MGSVKPQQFPSLAFAGTPVFAATVLNALIAAGHRPRLVLTQPDRGAGRGRKRAPSAVKQAALEAALPVRTPTTAAEIRPVLQGESVDALVVAAYGLLLPPPALEYPRFGCINVHASLLPRWRGAAPIERALIAGDRETGISIMRMDEGLDTGPVFRQARVEIGPGTTGLALEHSLAKLGAGVLLKVLQRLETSTPRPQRGAATHAPKIGPRDSIPEWRQTAVELVRRMRALAYRAPVWATIRNTRVQMLSATPLETGTTGQPGTILASGKHEILIACGSGALRLESLKVIRGKGRVMGPADARNGFPDLFRAGSTFR